MAVGFGLSARENLICVICANLWLKNLAFAIFAIFAVTTLRG